MSGLTLKGSREEDSQAQNPTSQDTPKNDVRVACFFTADFSHVTTPFSFVCVCWEPMEGQSRGREGQVQCGTRDCEAPCSKTVLHELPSQKDLDQPRAVPLTQLPLPQQQPREARVWVAPRMRGGGL